VNFVNIEVKEKRTILGYVFAIAGFYSVINAVILFGHAFSGFAQSIRFDMEHHVPGLVMTIIATIVAIAGLVALGLAVFTKKIPERNFVALLSGVVLTLVILFGIGIIANVDGNMNMFPTTLTLQQAASFAIVLGIYLYQYRELKSKPKEIVVDEE